MNLLNDFVSYLKEEMDNNNITYGECNDLHDYVMIYFEVKERNIVFEEPYSILESDDFKEEKKLLDLDEKTILNEIYLKIQDGKNIDNMFTDFLFYLDFVKDVEYDINNDAVIE